MTSYKSFIKHFLKLLLRPEYRNYYIENEKLKQIEWLKDTPRYTSVATEILGKPLQLVDGRSFYYSYKEIFQEQIYRFKATNDHPLIIDCGSNIGLSIIFFKQLYPQSKIIAFEADPEVFKTLQMNLETFSYNDVEVYNKALWNQNEIIEFAVEGADCGKVNIDQIGSDQPKIKIPAICLSNFLSEPVDFLKIDIEGAETTVLQECRNQLDKVNNLFVEYHSFQNFPQTLDELLSILKNAGFRFSINTQFASSQPFIKKRVRYGMDLQLNIFAYRI